MTNQMLHPDQSAELSTAALDVGGRELQRSSEGLARAVRAIRLDPKIVSGLDRIGRDMHSGIANLAKTTEAISSAFANSEAATAFNRIGRDMHSGIANLAKSAGARDAALLMSTMGTCLVSAQHVPSDWGARRHIFDALLDAPASKSIRDDDIESAPADDCTGDTTDWPLILLLCMASLMVLLLAAQIASPGELADQIRFWLALSNVPTERWPEVGGLMNLLAVIGLWMTMRLRRYPPDSS